MSSMLHKQVNQLHLKLSDEQDDNQNQHPVVSKMKHDSDSNPAGSSPARLHHSLKNSHTEESNLFGKTNKETSSRCTTTHYNKSYSENDLRILSNPHHQDDSCCHGEYGNGDGNGDGTSISNGNYPPSNNKIGPIRSDYIAIEAASKQQNNENIKKHSLNTFRKKLIHQHSAIYERSNDTSSMGTNTIVVVPSIDLDGNELQRISSSVELYEGRQLYHLLLLSDPTFRVVFLSTYPICEEVVRYYLSLDKCSSDVLSERLSRLFLLTPGQCEYSQSPLSNKVVNDHKLITTIREIVDRVSNGVSPSAGLNVFCGSNAADDLASQLELRLLEASGSKLYYGSKQGSREIFRSCCVPHPPGTPDIGDEDLLTSLPNVQSDVETPKFIRTPRALAIGIARQIALKNVKPKRWVVKLNQGFSGKGNAIIDLQLIQNKSYVDSSGCLLSGDSFVDSLSDDIEKEFSEMKFMCPSMSWNGNEYTGFKAQIKRLGVIAEAFLEGENLSSPSVQAVVEPDRITGNHCVHILSTHEQVLDDQIYNGCINPASEHYRHLILAHTKKIGYELANHGVVGHFGTDFLSTCCHNSEGETIYDVSAIEINLRQGGTTHPFATMALLAGGDTDDDGIFRTVNGEKRCYIATDSHNDKLLVGLSSKEFLQIIQDEQNVDAVKLHWDNEKKIGVIFHILDFLKLGKIGFTAIGESSIHARHLFGATKKFLNGIAEQRASAKYNSLA